jgi:hypothetical protein
VDEFAMLLPAMVDFRKIIYGDIVFWFGQQIVKRIQVIHPNYSSNSQKLHPASPVFHNFVIFSLIDSAYKLENVEKTSEYNSNQLL